MEIQLKKQRAHELATFLKCSPSSVQDPKNYLKIQRFRIAIDKANSDYKGVLDAYTKKMQEEAKPFQEAMAEFRFQPDLQKEKSAEFDAQLQEIMKPEAEKINAYVREHGEKTLSVTVDTEELTQAKLYFEKLTKVGEEEVCNGARYWLDPEAYMEVIDILGIK